MHDSGIGDVLVFTYGTLCEQNFAHTLSLHSGAVDVLPGWGLICSTYLTVIKEADKQTMGVVWEADVVALKSLDRYEGFPNLYRREKVTLASGREALVYVMNGYQGKVEMKPSPDNHTRARAGYKQFGIPQDQIDIAQLRSMAAVAREYDYSLNDDNGFEDAFQEDLTVDKGSPADKDDFQTSNGPVSLWVPYEVPVAFFNEHGDGKIFTADWIAKTSPIVGTNGHVRHVAALTVRIGPSRVPHNYEYNGRVINSMWTNQDPGEIIAATAATYSGWKGEGGWYYGVTAVHKDWRNMGIGKWILRHRLEVQALVTPNAHMQVSIDPANTLSRKMCLAVGYTACDNMAESMEIKLVEGMLP